MRLHSSHSSRSLRSADHTMLHLVDILRAARMWQRLQASQLVLVHEVLLMLPLSGTSVLSLVNIPTGQVHLSNIILLTAMFGHSLLDLLWLLLELLLLLLLLLQLLLLLKRSFRHRSCRRLLLLLQLYLRLELGCGHLLIDISSLATTWVIVIIQAKLNSSHMTADVQFFGLWQYEVILRVPLSWGTCLLISRRYRLLDRICSCILSSCL